MSNGKLKVIIVGKLHLEPDVQQSRHGMVVNLTIPINEVWTDKKTGKEHKRTEWTRVAVFNRNAQIAAAYLRKGSGVYIEGTLRTEKIDDPHSGHVRYSTKAICQVLELTDKDGDQGSDQASNVVSVAPDTADTVGTGVIDECSYSCSYEIGANSSNKAATYNHIQSCLP